MFDWLNTFLAWLGLLNNDSDSTGDHGQTLSLELQASCSASRNEDDASCGAIMDPDG